MKAKTKLFLYQLLWTADTFAQPTYRNIFDSFEGWAYRKGLLWQIHRLEAEGFLESEGRAFKRKRVVRLTEAGRRAALGGRDPEALWSGQWDRKWRLVLFDLPEREHRLRKELHRALRSNGCGCLQGSLWISPRPVPEDTRIFEHPGSDCSHLILLEAESRGQKVDRQMVRSAYPFSRINELYREHIALLREGPPRERDAEALLEWSTRENNAWLEAIGDDPLLPAELLPKDYLGRKAWEQRKRVLKGMESRARNLLPHTEPIHPNRTRE
ncbi:MAG: hypothetical protein JJT96_13105 [Opitutales bacterium]|nr:hypothetical protein [Opitutales bacterium]